MRIKSILGTMLFESGAKTLSQCLNDAISKKADLHGADLRGANLGEADLGEADLREADLGEADLREAYLRGADLRGANLRGADLRGADLRGADLNNARGLYPIVPEEGAFVGFKKLRNGVIAKILIPEGAGRVGGYTGRKCRAERAVVLEGDGISQYDGNCKYQPGLTVVPDAWDPDPRVECSHGIHFLLTRREAEEY